MEFIGISIDSIGKFFLIVAVFHIAILGFVLADLRSGVRKAVQNGIYRSSIKYRETINKLARYYNMSLVLTLLDVIVVFSMACLGWVWYPHFPFATMIATVGVGCIEIKSIFEKWDDKQKMEARDVAVSLAKMYKNGGLEEVKKALDQLSTTNK